MVLAVLGAPKMPRPPWSSRAGKLVDVGGVDDRQNRGLGLARLQRGRRPRCPRPRRRRSPRRTVGARRGSVGVLPPLAMRRHDAAHVITRGPASRRGCRCQPALRLATASDHSVAERVPVLRQLGPAPGPGSSSSSFRGPDGIGRPAPCPRRSEGRRASRPRGPRLQSRFLFGNWRLVPYPSARRGGCRMIARNPCVPWQRPHVLRRLIWGRTDRPDVIVRASMAEPPPRNKPFAPRLGCGGGQAFPRRRSGAQSAFLTGHP